MKQMIYNNIMKIDIRDAFWRGAKPYSGAASRVGLEAKLMGDGDFKNLANAR